MIFNIPKSIMFDSIKKIDMCVGKGEYPLISDYAYIKRGSVTDFGSYHKIFMDYWFSDTFVEKNLCGKEVVYQCKPYGSAWSPTALLGVRPTIDYEYILEKGVFIKNFEYNQYGIYLYGEYPQKYTTEYESCLLENLYNQRKLNCTGNKYAYISKGLYNEFDYDLEYEYNGRKYVRAQITGTYKYFVFNEINKNKIFNDEYMWISVEPVYWVVDHINKFAITEGGIIGSMPYNDVVKDGIENTFLGNYLKENFANEIDKSFIKENDNVLDEVNNLELWLANNHVHPIIYMFLLKTNGIYLDSVDWIRISDELYNTCEFSCISNFVNKEIYEEIYNMYYSLNINEENIINNNVNIEILNNLTNIKKYLLICLLMLIDTDNYDKILKFINDKLGEKYLKTYLSLYEYRLIRENNKIKKY